jgi:hypothetical protein
MRIDLRPIVAICFFLALPAGWHAALADDAPAPGGELLQPAKAPQAGNRSHQLRYKLSDGSDKWDTDAKARITKAMDEAVAVYNKYGDFDKLLTANWSPGTPTADANFGGWINFGGQIGTRTALHEIAHCLGVGTAPNWERFAKGGKWTGQYAIDQLKQLDGPDAVLHCDHQHFWPYGLNYDNEGGPDAFRRNVLMVTALRADMGLGPPPDPAAAALKAARIEQTAAKLRLTRAQSDLTVLENKIKSGLASRPEVIAAANALSAARAAHTAAVDTALKSLHAGSAYQAARDNADRAAQHLEQLRSENPADSTAIETAAAQVMAAKTELTRMDAKALSDNQAVGTSTAALATAQAAYDKALQAPLDTDPDLIAAREKLAAAKSTAAKADQAVITAQAAADAEAKKIAEQKKGP